MPAVWQLADLNRAETEACPHHRQEWQGPSAEGRSGQGRLGGRKRAQAAFSSHSRLSCSRVNLLCGDGEWFAHMPCSVNLCVYACVCELLLIPFLSWSPVSEASGVWDLQREEGYKRARQETPVPGFRASAFRRPPRGPSPRTLQLEKAIVLCPGL